MMHTATTPRAHPLERLRTDMQDLAAFIGTALERPEDAAALEAAAQRAAAFVDAEMDALTWAFGCANRVGGLVGRTCDEDTDRATNLRLIRDMLLGLLDPTAAPWPRVAFDDEDRPVREDVTAWDAACAQALRFARGEEPDGEGGYWPPSRNHGEAKSNAADTLELASRVLAETLVDIDEHPPADASPAVLAAVDELRALGPTLMRMQALAEVIAAELDPRH